MTKTTKKEKNNAKTNQLKVSILSGGNQVDSGLDLASYFTDEETKKGFSPDFIQQILHIYLNNRRQATAKVKTRSEVSGGGKKPWRQKGTGRARHGTIRSPLWRSGGITFGPTGEQNFTKKLTKKMKKKALRFGIMSMINENKIVVLDSLEQVESTKKMNSYLSKLPLSSRNILVLDQKNMKIMPYARNIEYLAITTPELINPLDLFINQVLICTKESFESILNRVKPDKNEKITNLKKDQSEVKNK